MSEAATPATQMMNSRPLSAHLAPLGIELPKQIQDYSGAEKDVLYTDFTSEIDRLMGASRKDPVARVMRAGNHAIIIARHQEVVEHESHHEFGYPHYTGPTHGMTIRTPLAIEGLDTNLVQSLRLTADQTRQTKDGDAYKSIGVGAEIGTVSNPSAGNLPNLPILKAFGIEDRRPGVKDTAPRPWNAVSTEVDFYSSSGAYEPVERLFGAGVEILRVLEPNMLRTA